jgi:hypothetical protein
MAPALPRGDGNGNAREWEPEGIRSPASFSYRRPAKARAYAADRSGDELVIVSLVSTVAARALTVVGATVVEARSMAMRKAIAQVGSNRHGFSVAGSEFAWARPLQ